MARLGSWIEPFPEGIYIRPADAWVDPSEPKARALVTHGHADHARGGHQTARGPPGPPATRARRPRRRRAPNGLGAARDARHHGLPLWRAGGRLPGGLWRGGACGGGGRELRPRRPRAWLRPDRARTWGRAGGGLR